MSLWTQLAAVLGMVGTGATRIMMMATTTSTIITTTTTITMSTTRTSELLEACHGTSQFLKTIGRTAAPCHQLEQFQTVADLGLRHSQFLSHYS